MVRGVKSSSLTSSGVKFTCSVLAFKTIVIEPMAIRTIAVTSYYQMNFSPSSLVERIMLTMIAVQALQARRVKSTNGRTSAWTMTFMITKLHPITHLGEQYVRVTFTLSRST